MNSSRLRSIMIGIIVLALVRGVLYTLLIPFDNAPDENFYFRLIKAKQLELAGVSEAETQRAAAEFEVVRRILLYPTGTSLPVIEDFANAQMLQPPPATEIYYLIGARLLQLLSLANMRDEIYAMRGLSIVCGGLIVIIAFFTTRELFPDNRFLLIGVPLFMTFIPQFAATNGMVNNDKLAEVFTACVFWCLVKLFREKRLVLWVGIGLAFTILALLGKRTAVFLVPFWLVALFVYCWKGSLGVRLHVLIFGVLCAGAIGANALAGYLHEMDTLLNHYLIWLPPHRVKMLVSDVFSTASLIYYLKFFTVLYWSFWGIFGYMTIHLHHGWYVLAAIGQGASIVGLGKLMLRARLKKPTRLEGWQLRVLYLFGVSIVLMVLVMLYRSIFARIGGEPMLEQGRRFFVGIVPISILTLVGIAQLVPPRYHRLAGGLGLAGLVAMDTVSLTNYVLLNFHGMTLW